MGQYEIVEGSDSEDNQRRSVMAEQLKGMQVVVSDIRYILVRDEFVRYDSFFMWSIANVVNYSGQDVDVIGKVFHYYLDETRRMCRRHGVPEDSLTPEALAARAPEFANFMGDPIHGERIRAAQGQEEVDRLDALAEEIGGKVVRGEDFSPTEMMRRLLEGE